MSTLSENRKNEIINLLAYAKSKKQSIEHIYNLAQKHFNVSEIKNNYHDSTGILIKNKLINRLASTILNSSYIWAHIEPPKYMRSKVSENDKIELDTQTRVVFDDIQNISNFEFEKTKILNDYLLGTTVFKCESTGDYRRPTRFRHAPLGNCYILEGPDSLVNTVFYKNEKMRVNNIKSIWPSSNSVELETLNVTKEYDVWECTVYNYSTKKYDYIVSVDESLKNVLFYEEQEDSPWIVGRWENFEYNSPYGAGPCAKAIMELMALRKTKNSINKIRDYQSDPPIISYGDRRLAMAAKILPGRNTFLGEGQNQTVIKPFLNGASPDIQMFDLKEHKDILNDLFYIDFITSIKNVEDLKNITATATQIAVTKFAEQIDPIYSRMQKEILEQVVRKVRDNNLKANVITNNNIQYLKENTKLTVRFHNALTIAQDQEDMERNNLFIQDIASKFGPLVVAAMIKSNEYIKNTASRLNITRDEFILGEELESKVQQLQQNVMQPEQQEEQV
ncbi:MAG: portal protein [Cetobacterium sp.]